MRALMFRFLYFLRNWLLACVARLILLLKFDIAHKKEACRLLQDYYRQKALKPLLKAAELEIKIWQYAAIRYPDTYCKKNVKIAQRRYDDMFNGKLGEDFGIRIVFKDEADSDIPTDEDIKWAKEVLKRKGLDKGANNEN